MSANINFSTNWNNKLDCKAFTTLRLRNPNKYVIGKEYNILLNGQLKKRAIIEDMKTIHLSDINEFIARIDTGYSAHETKNIIQKMYANKVKDLDAAYFSFILLKTTT